MILCISVVSVVKSPFSFVIQCIWILFLFGESSKRFLYFLKSFLKKHLSFIDLFYCLFTLYFIYFHSNFFILKFQQIWLFSTSLSRFNIAQRFAKLLTQAFTKPHIFFIYYTVFFKTYFKQLCNLKLEIQKEHFMQRWAK